MIFWVLYRIDFLFDACLTLRQKRKSCFFCRNFWQFLSWIIEVGTLEKVPLILYFLLQIQNALVIQAIINNWLTSLLYIMYIKIDMKTYKIILKNIMIFHFQKLFYCIILVFASIIVNILKQLLYFAKSWFDLLWFSWTVFFKLSECFCVFTLWFDIAFLIIVLYIITLQLMLIIQFWIISYL